MLQPSVTLKSPIQPKVPPTIRRDPTSSESEKEAESSAWYLLTFQLMNYYAYLYAMFKPTTKCVLYNQLTPVVNKSW